MISTKTYIPAKPRSKKLVGTSIGGISGGTGTGGVLTVEQSQILIDAVKTKDDLENLRIGSVNLLRNTGFLGDFRSLDVDALTAVIAETPVATNEFAYWLQEGCSVIDAPSKSGKGARIGHLQQNTPILQLGETYTLTFWARGTTLTASIVEETIVPLTDEYKQYEMKIVIPETKGHIFMLSDATGTAEVYNIQLERGNRATDYNYSPEDDLKAISQLQAINVITSAIKDGNTDILGGLILTSMIQLGKYKDGVMERVNAGISGIYNNDDDPAVWAGGTMEMAIRTVQKFIANPNYQPTEEEWADMAKIVFTHGGDGFFRGYIYALGGIFRGKVETSISGNRIVIDPEDKSLKMFNEAGAMALAMEFNEHPMGFNDARINVFTYNNEGEVMYNAQMMPTGVSIMYTSQNEEVSIVNQATVNAREISILGYTSDGIDYNEQYKFEVTNNTIGDGSLRIRTTGMPTSSTGLMSGEWYVDGGAIKVKS